MEEEDILITSADFQPTAIVTMDTNRSLNSVSSIGISVDVSAVISWREREIELSTISRYKENWDAENSLPAHPLTIALANYFLQFLKRHVPSNPPVRVLLSSRGSIAMEWLDRSSLLRAEVSESDADQVEWMRATAGQPARFWYSSLTGTSASIKAKQGQTWPTSWIGAEELDFPSVR